jgi:hypothetical protein
MGTGRICQFAGASTSVWSVSQSDQFSRNVKNKKEGGVCSVGMPGFVWVKSAIRAKLSQKNRSFLRPCAKLK